MIDGNRTMEVQVHIHMMRFKADIYISHFLFISLYFFLSHFFISYPVLRFSFLLTFSSLSLSLCLSFVLTFFYSSSIFVLACCTYFTVRFIHVQLSSFINEIKAGASPPDFHSSREREREDGDPEMVMMCNFHLNMVG